MPQVDEDETVATAGGSRRSLQPVRSGASAYAGNGQGGAVGEEDELVRQHILGLEFSV